MVASHAIITSGPPMNQVSRFVIYMLGNGSSQSPPMGPLPSKWLLPDFARVFKICLFIEKLSYLTFDDLTFCAEQMLDHWTVGSIEGSSAADVGDTGAEFDRVFLQELRDLKVFVNDREIVEEHKSLVCSDITKRFTRKLAKSVESNFKNLCRALLNIAAGLIHSKEVKDVLSDFVEKFIEPCKQLEWDSKRQTYLLVP
ncbi:hypothetical protein OS493_012798 [Desmophyllum pertusum]|uniref:Uncharacterized protein n=1 Tax=Desmophyllum pertusum TaxID=174260 RepID=A0A9X0CYC0_9CNID|nr:hypothetical protein OS493_012798 [Desmophyllum pertusum]